MRLLAQPMSRPPKLKPYKTLGADAVGMSDPTRSDPGQWGRNEGSRRFPASPIYAAGISEHALSHEEVTETTDAAMPHMKNLITGFIRELSKT